MSKKSTLRKQRKGTIINLTSRQQESKLGKAIPLVIKKIKLKFDVTLVHEKKCKIHEIVSSLRQSFPDVEFAYHLDSSFMEPDGGILYISNIHGDKKPILIAEVKNQGTNDLRKAEGKPKQSKGNAIERLGKNVIGFRTAMLSESIVPFVCFGYGCDFADGSSILDRVTTIAMFGPLNQVNVINQGDAGFFNRGSFFFREKPWTVKEMSDVMLEIASKSIYYYFSKYGEDDFIDQ